MIWPSHGSNPQYLYEAVGLSLPQKYLDFSANINPLGPPNAIKDNWADFYNDITVYPDPYAKRLKKLIGKKEHVSADSLLIGNGGAELITLVARMLTDKNVLLVQPTFSEYEKACRANNCQIVSHQLAEPSFGLSLDVLRSKLMDADAVFLCNPNNPTGIRYQTPAILTLIEECAYYHCYFILDEAFYDFLLDYDSFLPYVNRFSNLIIIRSMTKMFAIPGIRLGYLAAQPHIIAELSKLQSHWSTNAIALLTGELCVQNNSFIKETQVYINNERTRLFQFFRELDFMVSPSEVNFYLLRDPHLEDQFPFFEFLLKKGMIPRHTFNFPGLEGKWLRFAIKGIAENNRLMEVLTEWRRDHR
ncbi:threonine-phosphate decarboxylase CobD [Bacillus sp. EB600]|uniref:threonine-phosphate decarboxylase CobD n=1 Tax=Bacillus sp. EB600 TaxID=2806345 RepID=UPI00210B82B1|nr:threonine-phosphate decarboxylase CobD [Bacillus sp. EB600]MCQ6279209.1 threonine-phosphate decarboxylase [Bacillus sp. EB600]